MLSGISIGAVGAAFVTALASMLGLIISKESKVSEFRQAWVDALRAEMSTYLTNLEYVRTAFKIERATLEERLSDVGPHLNVLNNAYFMISLRLNPNEPHARRILECMDEFEALVAAENAMENAFDDNAAGDVEKRFLAASKLLLKMEWDRVKKGELTFQIAKIVSFVIIIVLVILGVIAESVRPSVYE